MRGRVFRTQLQGLETGGTQVFVHDASGLAIADDVQRTGHRICRDGQSACHGLQQHQSERIRLAGKHEDVSGSVYLAPARADRARPGSSHPDIAPGLPSTRALPRRPTSSPEGPARRNASMFFSTATRPTYRKIGGLLLSRSARCGLKISRSTPRDQVTTFLKPYDSRSVLTTCGRGHHGRGRSMKPAQESIRPGQRHAACAHGYIRESACDKRS